MKRKVAILFFALAPAFGCAPDSGGTKGGDGGEPVQIRGACNPFPIEEIAPEEVPPVEFDVQDVGAAVDGVWNASCPATTLLPACNLQLSVDVDESAAPSYVIATAFDPDYEVTHEDHERCWGMHVPTAAELVVECDAEFSTTFDLVWVHGISLAQSDDAMDGGSETEPRGIPLLRSAVSFPEVDANGVLEYEIALSPEPAFWFAAFGQDQPPYEACETEFTPSP